MLKGPGAFVWGGGALAGSVQVVRKHPVAARFADLTLAYGRYGTYEAAADANLASRDGKLAFRLNAVGQGTDGYRDGREARSRESTRASFGGPTRDAGGALLRVPAQQPVARLRAAVPGRRARGRLAHASYQSPSDFSEQDVQRLRLDAERRLNDTFVLRDKLYFSALDWNTDGTLVLGAFPFPDGRTYVPRTQGLLDDRQRLFGNQLELVASFHTGDVAHQLVTGFEASRLATPTPRTPSCCSRSISRTRSKRTSASTRSRCRRRARRATRAAWCSRRT